MSNNNLTPTQDIITRDFWRYVATDPDLFPSNPVLQAKLLSTVLKLLNYTHIAGAFVDPASLPNTKFGQTPVVTCEWSDDEDKARSAIDEANNSTSTGEADSGEPSTDTEVREAVLREDV